MQSIKINMSMTSSVCVLKTH